MAMLLNCIIFEGMGDKLGLLKQLDIVLQFFALREIHLGDGTTINTVDHFDARSARKIIMQLNPVVCDNAEFNSIFNEIIDKLIKDGYLEKLTDRGDALRITFNGRVWLAQGGYDGKLKENNREAQRAREYHILTWILAVGVSTPFLKDLIDVVRDYYNPILYFLVYILVPFCFVLILLWSAIKGIQRLRKLRK